jgi:hypothetical protein
MGVEESQRVSWFAEFASRWEAQVRMSLEARDWETALSKKSCATEWLRQQEESRAFAASAIRDARARRAE